MTLETFQNVFLKGKLKISLIKRRSMNSGFYLSVVHGGLISFVL